MTRQPHLFDSSTATVRTKQGRLFNDAGPRESGLSCECGEPMVRTQSGYLSCPRMCGKLVEAVSDERGSGLWFEEDLPE